MGKSMYCEYTTASSRCLYEEIDIIRFWPSQRIDVPCVLQTSVPVRSTTSIASAFDVRHSVFSKNCYNLRKNNIQYDNYFVKDFFS